MPVTKRGIVYYADDPHQRVFRVVYPENDDSELDFPVTDANRKQILDGNGQPHTWANWGVDTTRTATLTKISSTDTTPRLRGTPWTSSTEPVVYWVNADAALSALTSTQQKSVANWLAAHPTWSNNFVDLGNGDVPTLTASLVSPCWIVVVGGGTPAIGTLQRSGVFAGSTAALWTA